MQSASKARSGVIIPVVIFCLVAMAILGVVLISNATSQYMQTAKVAADLKIREVMLAGLEEAHALAYDRLNRPPARGQPPPAWHTELAEALRRAGDTPRGVLVVHDLKTERLLPRTTAIASTLACEITSASVELLGFRRLCVDSRGLFEDPRIYYRDPDRVLDPAGSEAKFTPVREWVGSMRMRITVRWERSRASLSRVSDVKVVDVYPSAREFVLFSFLSTSREQDNGPDSDEYFRTDLRRGGPVKLFAHARGRIFVRGPFLVDTVGIPGGQGGKRPPRTSSFSPTQENEWWGWSLVPSTHDGMMCRAGPSLINFGMPPMRPDSSSDWRLFKGLITDRFGSSWADWFDDDPGYYILDGQRWYSESISSDRNVFSIWGDPAGGRMEPFAGAFALYDGGRRTAAALPANQIQERLINRPPDEDRRYVIEPEGGLYGLYNVVEYHGDTYAKGLYQRYGLTSKGQVMGRLGLHWEKRYELGWLNQFVIDLISGGTIFGPAWTVPLMLLPRSVAESVSITLASWVGLDLSRRNTLTDLSGITPDKLSNALPPGYRPPARAVTRRYKRLSDLVARQGQRPVLLDGVIAFDDMSCDRPLAYVGRGMFYSEQATPPTLTAPISAPTAGDTSSYLTLHHEGPVRQAHRGAAMLTLRSGSGGRTVNAAVYATQGVKPSGAITVNGNLTCGYPNKAQIPDSSQLEVTYRPPPGNGLVSAVSPRTAVFVDR